VPPLQVVQAQRAAQARVLECLLVQIARDVRPRELAAAATAEYERVRVERRTGCPVLA
jgi:hypothetical protein